MSSSLAIYLTKFVDIDADGTETGSTYGIRVDDGSITAYTNGLEREDVVGKTPSEIVQLVREMGDEAADAVEFAQLNGVRVEISGVSYSWDEIGAAGPSPSA